MDAGLAEPLRLQTGGDSAREIGLRSPPSHHLLPLINSVGKTAWMAGLTHAPQFAGVVVQTLGQTIQALAQLFIQ